MLASYATLTLVIKTELTGAYLYDDVEMAYPDCPDRDWCYSCDGLSQHDTL